MFGAFRRDRAPFVLTPEFVHVFEGDDRTQFFFKKYPRDTGVSVTRFNNRMVKFTYARLPVADGRPERVWTEIERCRPIAEVMSVPMADKGVNGYDMLVVFLARAVAGPEPPRPMGMLVPPDLNLPMSSRTAQDDEDVRFSDETENPHAMRDADAA